jgi:hypothetical protein
VPHPRPQQLHPAGPSLRSTWFSAREQEFCAFVGAHFFQTRGRTTRQVLTLAGAGFCLAASSQCKRGTFRSSNPCCHPATPSVAGWIRVARPGSSFVACGLTLSAVSPVRRRRLPKPRRGAPVSASLGRAGP